MKKVLLALLLLVAPAFAANHYVRQGASGNGSDWTNACGDFTGSCAIASLVRGDTYYVADGTYAAQTWNTPISGTLVITIKKATAADHGTDTGWVSTYGDGEAVWSSAATTWTFSTPGYFVFDGQVGSGNSPGTYGFRVRSTASRTTAEILVLFQNGTNHLTFKHIDFDWNNGTGTADGAVTRHIYTEGTSNDITIDTCYFHHSSGFVFYIGPYDPAPTGDLQNNYLIQNNYFYMNGGGGGTAHWELMWLMNFDNSIIRYNTVQDTLGGGQTGWVMMAKCDNVKIYGNLFFCQDAACVTGGNGVVATWSADAYRNDSIWVVNNSFIDLVGFFQPQIYFTHNSFDDTNVTVKNNLYYNTEFDYAGITTQSHEACGGGQPCSGTNQQTGILTSKFVNYAGNDFRLASATTAGDPTVGAEFNTDMFGNVRGADGTWDRGAFEFGTGSTSTFKLISLFKSNATVVDPYAACELTDTTGYTIVSTPQTLSTLNGKYALPKGAVVHCDNTCFGLAASGIELHLNGGTLIPGENPTSFAFDVQKTPSGTGNDIISTGKGTYAAIYQIDSVGNTQGANDYTYGTQYYPCTDVTYNNGHVCSQGNRINWQSGQQPGSPFWIAGRVREPSYGVAAGAVHGSLTNFTTIPLSTANDAVIKCGKIQLADTLTSSMSGGILAQNRSNWTIQDVDVVQTNTDAWDQHYFMSEQINGLTILRGSADIKARNTMSRDNQTNSAVKTGTHYTAATTVTDFTVKDAGGTAVVIASDNSVVRNLTTRLHASKYTNQFSVETMGDAGNIEIDNLTHVTWDPNDLTLGGRGVHLQGDDWIHNSRLLVHSHNINLEYAGGCELIGSTLPTGGPFGIQSEGTANNRSNNNDVTGVADTCGVRARRFTSVGSSGTPGSAYFQNDVYRAFKTSATSAGDAVGLSLSTLWTDTTNAVGASGVDSRIEADTYNVEVSSNANAKFKRLTFVKGTTNPDYTCGTEQYGICSHPESKYATWRMISQSSPVTVECVDCAVENGASLTSASGFIENASFKHWDLYISWTYTVHATSGGSPLSGATVTMTDTLGNPYSGTTNASGDAALELRQHRVYSSGTVAVNQENRNPFSLQISKAGCTTLNASNITVSAPTTDNRTVACP